MPRTLKRGPGWQIGWDDDAPEFAGLVGGDDWALELTAAELEDFCRLLGQLADTMSQVATELMAEERLTCELESDRLWLEVEGFPQSYSLRMIVLTGRRAEVGWSAAAVSGLVQAAQSLKFF
ncbi:MAG: hypothetical protein Fur0046_25950 [Cyanobacteria bacterium J069]|nr:MAG: DUF1818 family protein [Cyanobacteria bacterium J069]